MNKNYFQPKQPICLAASSPAASSETNYSPLTTHYSLKQILAFTLAEVLITLGIISIVATLTLPTLIEMHNQKVVEARLKKVYSTINQAIQMAESDYGEREAWFVDYNDLASQKKWIEKYLLPYLNYTKFEEVQVSSGNYRNAIYFADGSVLTKLPSNGRDWWFFPGNIEKCLKLSATNYKNNMGKCVFAFYYNPASNTTSHAFNSYGIGSSKTEEIFKYDTDFGCYQKNTWKAYCTALIQYNGWQIPKDYPYRVYY